MKTMNHLISVKTLTDYHLESFIRCPYQFYYQYILRKDNGELKWRRMVQSSINNIIYNYYHLPLQEQNKLYLLMLMDQHWKPIHPNLFENKAYYYIVLAKVTNHLLSFLTANTRDQPPLFLYERLQTSIGESDTKLSLSINVGEWSKHSFCLKKFLLDGDKELIDLYKYMMIVFSKKAFGFLPDQIDVLSILDGKCYVVHPTEQDVTKGSMYLEFVKKQLQNPDSFFKVNGRNNCPTCTYNQECDFHDRKETDRFSPSLKTVMH